MEKINFIKTFIPQGDFREKYEHGGMMVRHLAAMLDEKMGAYECYECTVPIGEYDEGEIQKAFIDFTSKMDALKLKQAKVEKIAEITAYDTSSAVNSFILNGVPRWLNLDKRQSIAYSAKILKEKGHDSITIWFDTDKVVLPIDDAISLLDTLEVYAKTTNNVTHEHMLTVDLLSDIEEVHNFDVTAGYPRKVDY